MLNSAQWLRSERPGESRMRKPASAILAAVTAAITGLSAQNRPAEWTQPQAPVRIFGNTFYVGSRGLSAILITSDAGHVLIDGALPETAPMVAAKHPVARLPD